MNKRYKMTIPIVTTLILAVILNISGMGGAKNNNPVVSDQKASIQYRINDAHLHYVDFLQNTDGIELLLKAMDQAGVEQARANHIALDPVYIFAAEHDLPVWVHSDISSVWIQEPIYLYEMEEVVERVLSFLQAFLGKKTTPNRRQVWPSPE